MIILICIQGKSKFTSRKKNTKINILQIFSLKAQYIFHRNKYITIIGTIIWQHLYTQPCTIRKISGNGDAIHQFIFVQHFAMILPGPQEYLPGYKRKYDISENNTQKALATHAYPFVYCVIQGMFSTIALTSLHLLQKPFPGNQTV